MGWRVCWRSSNLLACMWLQKRAESSKPQRAAGAGAWGHPGAPAQGDGTHWVGAGTGEPWGQGRTWSWAVRSCTICNIPGQALVVPYRKCYRRCGCTPREPTSPAAPEGFCLTLTCGCLLGCWVRIAALSGVVGYRRHVAVPPFLTMERYFWEREEKYSSWFVLC